MENEYKVPLSTFDKEKPKIRLNDIDSENDDLPEEEGIKEWKSPGFFLLMPNRTKYVFDL